MTYLPQLAQPKARDWVNQYLGISWAPQGSSRTQCSCLGLRNLVYREQLDIDLADYSDVVDDLEKSEIDQLLERGLLFKHWREIDQADLKPFDIVSFQLRRLESHVGIVVDRRNMLHVCEGIQSAVEAFATPSQWSDLRPRFYRYDHRSSVSLPSLITPRVGPHIIRGLETFDATIYVPEGTTVLDAVRAAFPNVPPTAYRDIRVTIGHHVVSREYWHVCKPKMWDLVIIRVVPASTGLLKILLSIAVVIGAAAISGGALGPAGLGIAGSWLAAGSVSAAVAGAAFATAGLLLVNALIPVAKPDQQLPDQPSYNISGWSNQLNADGAVPSVLGQLRFAPPFAALPYMQNVGNDRFAHAIFLVGYGPVNISNIWIGNTPVENYPGLQIEIRYGYPGDPPLTLYPNQVIEDSDNPLDVTNANSQAVSGGGGGLGGGGPSPTDPPPLPPGSLPNTRITAANITYAELEFFFPQGLIAYDKDGHPKTAAVLFNISIRIAGSTTWATYPFEVVRQQQTQFYVSFSFALPVRGQYAIAVARLTPDYDDIIQYLFQDTKFVSKSTWSALRSYRPEYPLNYQKPMALIALVIKASGALGGTIQGVSCMARRICPDWDTPSQRWINRITSNPASLERYVHQGPENAFPRTDEMLDLLDFEVWGDYCTLKNLRFDAAYQGEQSQDQVLEDVARAGRAMPHDRGDKWSVIVDWPRTSFDGHLTPANTTDFTLTNPKVHFPDAFSVSFLDATNDYKQTRRIIPWPDLIGAPQIVQELPMPGKVWPDEIWIETRRRQFEAQSRQSSATLHQDMEQLTVTRGSGVHVSHYVVNQRQFAGYVKAIMAAGAIRLDTRVTMEAGQQYQALFRHTDGTSFAVLIVTQPGTRSTLIISSGQYVPGTPEIGDLVLFGRLTQVTSEYIVKGVTPGDGEFTATLNLIPSASNLDVLTDAEVAPPWDGIIGNEVTVVTQPPDVPLINEVLSGDPARAYDTTSNPHPIVVNVIAQGSVPTNAFQIRHKLDSSSTWIELTSFLPTDEPRVLAGYNVGDVVDIQARAIHNTVVSAWSASIVYTVLAESASGQGTGPILTSLTISAAATNLGEVTDAPASVHESLGEVVDAVTYKVTLGALP